MKTQKRMWQKELQAFLRLCFSQLSGYTKLEIAEKADLSTTTVYRLAKNGVSTKLRYETVLALGYAAGFSVKFVKQQAARLATRMAA